MSDYQLGINSGMICEQSTVKGVQYVEELFCDCLEESHQVQDSLGHKCHGPFRGDSHQHPDNDTGEQ